MVKMGKNQSLGKNIAMSQIPSSEKQPQLSTDDVAAMRVAHLPAASGATAGTMGQCRSTPAVYMIIIKTEKDNQRKPKNQPRRKENQNLPPRCA
jgi:hypothetical protein